MRLALLLLVAAGDAMAEERALPTQFVCSFAAGYAMTDNGTLEPLGQKVSGGVMTVDTQRGAVTGDAISAALFSWSLVPTVDKRSAIRLLGTSQAGTAMISILTSKPQHRGSDMFFPFVFFDAGTANAYSGTCRGTH